MGKKLILKKYLKDIHVYLQYR